MENYPQRPFASRSCKLRSCLDPQRFRRPILLLRRRPSDLAVWGNYCAIPECPFRIENGGMDDTATSPASLTPIPYAFHCSTCLQLLVACEPGRMVCGEVQTPRLHHGQCMSSSRIGNGISWIGLRAVVLRSPR